MHLSHLRDLACIECLSEETYHKGSNFVPQTNLQPIQIVTPNNFFFNQQCLKPQEMKLFLISCGSGPGSGA